jgi:hypothetical protein
MEYLGAWGTLIHEKNLKSKISCQTPFKNCFFGLKEHKFFDPGSFKPWILDPGSGMEKFGSGIQDKHPGSASATLFFLIHYITPANRKKKAWDLDSVCTVQAKFQRISYYM